MWQDGSYLKILAFAWLSLDGNFFQKLQTVKMLLLFSCEHFYNNLHLYLISIPINSVKLSFGFTPYPCSQLYRSGGQGKNHKMSSWSESFHDCGLWIDEESYLPNFFFFLFSCAFKLICLFALKYTLQVALLTMLPILMNTVFSWFPVGILQSTLGTPLILVLTFLDIPVLSYCAIHITLARITSWWVSSSIFIPDHLQFTDYNWLFFFFTWCSHCLMLYFQCHHLTFTFSVPYFI